MNQSWKLMVIQKPPDQHQTNCDGAGQSCHWLPWTSVETTPCKDTLHCQSSFVDCNRHLGSTNPVKGAQILLTKTRMDEGLADETTTCDRLVCWLASRVFVQYFHKKHSMAGWHIWPHMILPIEFPLDQQKSTRSPGVRQHRDCLSYEFRIVDALCIDGRAVVFKAISTLMWSPEVQGDWHNLWAASVLENRAEYVHNYEHSPRSKETSNQVQLSQSMQTQWLKECQCILAILSGMHHILRCQSSFGEENHVYALIALSALCKFSTSTPGSCAELRTAALSLKSACGAMS